MTCGCPYCAGGGSSGLFSEALTLSDGAAEGAGGKASFSAAEAAAQLTRNASTGFTPATPTPFTMTYSYRDTANAPAIPTGQTSWVGGLESGMAGFQKFNAAQIDRMEIALNLIEEVANVTFNRVGSGNAGPAAYSDGGQLLIGDFSSGPAVNIYDGFALRRSFTQGAGQYVRAAKVWFDGSRTLVTEPTNQNGAPRLYMHEIMHTLGLSHPGNYDASVPGYSYASSAVYAQDSGQYSLMSYFNESETGANFGGNNGMTPLLHDVAALQKLYGANMTTRTGNTVYGFNSNTGYEAYTLLTNASRRVFTIWDAGGEDTLDLSGYLTPTRINLGEETFSSAGNRNDGGLVIDNISIARGAIVENAKGGAGNDQIVGNAASNKLFGGGGRDFLNGKEGNDAIDGGAGIDFATYVSTYANARITQQGGSIIVTTPLEGTDTLTGVERLIFADRTVAVDVGAGQNAGVAYRLYQAAFARTPDQGGLSFWIKSIDAGGFTLNTAAAAFVTSAEFQRIYGVNPSNKQIVEAFYRNVLGREGEAGGVSFWVGYLNKGGSSADLLVNFSECAENQAQLAPIIGQGVAIDPLSAVV